MRIESAQAALEYALILAFLSLLMVGLLLGFGVDLLEAVESGVGGLTPGP